MTSYGPLCTEFYDCDKPDAPAEVFDFYLRRARQAGGRVLEAMCGSGRFLLPLLEASIDVEGVDESLPMLEACRRRAALRRLCPVLYEQSLEDLRLPKRYRMAFVSSGSIGLVHPDKLDLVFRSLCRHLESGSCLLMEIVPPSSFDQPATYIEPRTVMVDERTAIVYNCECALSPDGKSMQYAGRYEKRTDGRQVATEDELLVLWRLDPADVLTRLRACGFSRACVLDAMGDDLDESDGCLFVEARTASQ